MPSVWHPRVDWDLPSGKPNARTMLIGVYSYALEHDHKPKLRRLKRAIVTHHHFAKRNQSVQCRAKGCRRLLQIQECMLAHHVEIASAPFEPVLLS